MVRTMASLRAPLRTARRVRHSLRLSAGLPPADAVMLDAPDSRLSPALVAAAEGAYGPAAKLLATTRDTAAWELRDRYLGRLAAFAHGRDGWLREWLAAAPGDPDAVLVRAALAVRRAWEAPAAVERLREVAPLITAAAEADPHDPVPWRLALDHARGTRASHTAFGAVWEEAVRRSPHHYGCHVAALRYLSASWQGSHRACFDFAERAAEDAAPDSLVQGLPVRAALHLLLDPGAGGSTAAVPPERIEDAADLAIGLSARYPAGDPWPAGIRNLLAYVLVARARWEEALEQFRLIGPYAQSFPWSSGGEDALARFLEARDGARLQVASATPLWARAGHGGPPGHYA
ncbi:hypothetical protein OG233_23800 [Streptomyces sp. NBC_01218]|uniref:hypothetical protein n=1 Tax=unclassified Streptomyces TaxID=2593676 RepID=UPI0023B9A242|nr:MULTISPECIES: hypothetical protein [unclassified Streptomyces]WEH42302.1 hypothetical protein PZB77_23960 [Streptomyces sp. AM 2-1-1]WSQ53924.1 hypothetical protein OG233_23800 [Streptomyces sp. NBC_01218]